MCRKFIFSSIIFFFLQQCLCKWNYPARNRRCAVIFFLSKCSSFVVGPNNSLECYSHKKKVQQSVFPFPSCSIWFVDLLSMKQLIFLSPSWFEISLLYIHRICVDVFLLSDLFSITEKVLCNAVERSWVLQRQIQFEFHGSWRTKMNPECIH